MANEARDTHPNPTSNLAFLSPSALEWRSLVAPDGLGEEDAKKARDAAANARAELKDALLGSLQMQHVVALAGSGTSRGPVGGPSMWDLWDCCVNSNPESGDAPRVPATVAANAIAEIGFAVSPDRPDIEALLSRCEAWLQVHASDVVERFLAESKGIILKKCSAFLEGADEATLAAHRTFLHRLSRRRARDSRMKLFTTNYDSCFEQAAGEQGLVVVDGFSFSRPRVFDPRFFQYDIVRRPPAGDEVGNLLEGLFHLYKLHGSVDWAARSDGRVEIDPDPSPETACMIYPASGKYQQSYAQPHLELISQYLNALRQPNTCMLAVGFGFNDDHLSEPILSAATTNPHLRLIVIDPSAKSFASGSSPSNRYWGKFAELSSRGADVWLVNATFGEFAELIPDLGALSSAQRLVRDIKALSS